MFTANIPRSSIGQSYLKDVLETIRSDLLFSLETKYGTIDSRITRNIIPDLILIFRDPCTAQQAQEDLKEHFDRTGISLSVEIDGRSLVIGVGDDQ